MRQLSKFYILLKDALFDLILGARPTDHLGMENVGNAFINFICLFIDLLVLGMESRALMHTSKH
jgi:hypothetical protein